MSSLLEILELRENRMNTQRMLLQEGSCVICLTMNIPGPNKRSTQIDKGFHQGIDLINSAVQSMSIKVQRTLRLDADSGSTYYWLVNCDPVAVKKSMVAIEGDCELGRVFDIDVVTCEGIISRTQIGLSPRKCFICEENAHICARGQRHSQTEILEHIEQLLSVL